MKKILLIGLTLLMLCGCTSIPNNNPENNKVAFEDFGFEMFRSIDTKQNTVFSPFSMICAVNILMNAANGRTRELLVDRLNIDVESMNKMVKEKWASLENTANSTILDLANSLWIDTVIDKKDSFVLENLDTFVRNMEDDRTLSEINQWVSDNTRNLIPKAYDRMPDGLLALIMNTVYFKATWRHQFAESEIFDDHFFVGDEDITVPMMHHTAHYDYYKNKWCEGVVMPYDDGRTVMLALKGDPDEIVKNLSMKAIRQLLESKQTKKVSLTIPKFEISYRWDAKTFMTNYGLGELFTSADLSNLTDGDMCIDDIFQKAKIIVDGEGTEAAALSVIGVKATSVAQPEEILELRYDNPFVYLVYDMETETVLFMGTLYNPKAK